MRTALRLAAQGVDFLLCGCLVPSRKLHYIGPIRSRPIDDSPMHPLNERTNLPFRRRLLEYHTQPDRWGAKPPGHHLIRMGSSLAILHRSNPS